MVKRRIGRWLAPIALIVVVGAILAVVNNSDVGGKKDSASTKSTVTGASESTKKHTSSKSKKTTYTVHTGDTLSAIAEKTGVPLDEIEKLNPGLDAQSLHAGQKIKLVAS